MERRRRICILGFRAVGKSAVTLRFVEDRFNEKNYNATISNLMEKKLKQHGVNYVIEIVDTAGQDEYSPFNPNHFIGFDGYVLMYAVTVRSSFDVLSSINEKLLNAWGTEKVPRVLVGNKTDLKIERSVKPEEGSQLAQQLGVPFVECSAKLNAGINEVFSKLLTEIAIANGDPIAEKKTCIIC